MKNTSVKLIIPRAFLFFICLYLLEDSKFFFNSILYFLLSLDIIQPLLSAAPEKAGG
jgi:hypothetical protein